MCWAYQIIEDIYKKMLKYLSTPKKLILVFLEVIKSIL